MEEGSLHKDNGGYAICLNEWIFDKDIKNELGLLLIISSLCAKGYCYATNTYFSELFGISEETISRKLKLLEEKNYITIEYKKRGCEVVARYIRLTKLSSHDYQKYQPSIDKNINRTIDENVKENNISINITSINNKKNVKKKFIPPTLEEVKQYCEERKNNLDYQKFYDYYTAGKWKDKNGDQVKNWKQRVITWEGRNKSTQIKKEEVPDWFDKEIKNEEMTEEEYQELDNLLNSLKEDIKNMNN